jgi:myo-inositol-1(or 4)-monophosphatase
LGEGRSAAGARQATALLDIAVRATRPAVEILQAHATALATLRWEEKGPSDFVSDVDRAAERAIRAVIGELAPAAQMLGEELSPALGNRTPLASIPGVVFVVDPLDGTTNYLHGLPAYAVSIGVQVDGALVAGVVCHGVTGDLYTAVAGGGAFRNGARVSVSRITDPARSLIGTGFPFSHFERLDEYLPQFAAIAASTAGIRRGGSAALDLVDVACGRLEGFWELMLAPWDIAAGLLLIREAGGNVTDLAGRPAPVGHTGLVAGSPRIHAWLLDTLRHAATPAPGM